MFFRIQIFEGPGFSGSRFFRVRVIYVNMIGEFAWLLLEVAMQTRQSYLHKLSSREFCSLCTECSTSRVKIKSDFKDQPVYGCEMQEKRKLNYFFEIFCCNLH